jgi:hypothetical protein
LGAKWVKIIFVLWERQVPYDESYHLATMARQQLRQRPKKSPDMDQRKSGVGYWRGNVGRTDQP